MLERRSVKIGNFVFPESLYWSAVRRKMEEERRDREAVSDYHRQVRETAKDGQITFRIAKSDIVKLKRLAHDKNRRYQAYLREILKREIQKEIQLEEQRAAAAAPGKAGKRPH